jgi:nicotinamidase-related amidase
MLNFNLPKKNIIMEKQNNKSLKALLVMDVQGAIVKMLPDRSAFFTPLNKAIQFARDSQMQVIYVVVGFRKDYPEASPYNKSFANLKTSGRNLDSAGAFTVDETVAPQPGDIVVTKRRISAFTGSDLEVVLRAQAINEIVLTGIATSGVVLSTLREAADKDYVITVLSDCCADGDEEVHRVLTTKIFPRQADVMTAEEWCAKNKA